MLLYESIMAQENRPKSADYALSIGVKKQWSKLPKEKIDSVFKMTRENRSVDYIVKKLGIAHSTVYTYRRQELLRMGKVR